MSACHFRSFASSSVARSPGWKRSARSVLFVGSVTVINPACRRRDPRPSRVRAQLRHLLRGQRSIHGLELVVLVFARAALLREEPASRGAPQLPARDLLRVGQPRMLFDRYNGLQPLRLVMAVDSRLLDHFGEPALAYAWKPGFLRFGPSLRHGCRVPRRRGRVRVGGDCPWGRSSRARSNRLSQASLCRR